MFNNHKLKLLFRLIYWILKMIQSLIQFYQLTFLIIALGIKFFNFLLAIFDFELLTFQFIFKFNLVSLKIQFLLDLIFFVLFIFILVFNHLLRFFFYQYFQFSLRIFHLTYCGFQLFILIIIFCFHLLLLILALY
jgi:hypothetical protein